MGAVNNLEKLVTIPMSWCLSDFAGFFSENIQKSYCFQSTISFETVFKQHWPVAEISAIDCTPVLVHIFFWI